MREEGTVANLDRQREWLANTATDESRYSRAERKRLKLLARIVAARDAFPSGDEDEALAILLLRLSPRYDREESQRLLSVVQFNRL